MGRKRSVGTYLNRRLAGPGGTVLATIASGIKDKVIDYALSGITGPEYMGRPVNLGKQANPPSRVSQYTPRPNPNRRVTSSATWASSNKMPPKRPYKVKDRGNFYNKKPRTTYRTGKTRTIGFFGRFEGPMREKKFYGDVIVDGDVASTGDTFDDLVKIPQGTTEVTRIGRQVFIHEVYMQGLVKLQTTTLTTATADMVRIMVLIDHQCNGVKATVAEILESTSWKSYRNLVNVKRFTTLSDRTITMNANMAFAADTGEKFIAYKFSRRFRTPLQIELAGTDGTVDERKSNNIVVLLISEGGVCTVSLTTRVRYTD